MEAEMSLLMANQAKAAPGKMIYDPFAGTGSMLYVSVINLLVLVREEDLPNRGFVRT